MNLEKNVREIAKGFPTNIDRYSQAECERDPQAKTLADFLVSAPHHHPPLWVCAKMKDIVQRLFTQIPCRIVTCDGEPYTDAEAMRRDVRDRNLMYVRKRTIGPVLGKQTQKWRAVHDYYGHVEALGNFTYRGEWSAYARHTSQFPRECWPFIFNNVVTENSHRLVYGHFFCEIKQCPSKIVYYPGQFNGWPADEWYARAA